MISYGAKAVLFRKEDEGPLGRGDLPGFSACAAAKGEDLSGRHPEGRRLDTSCRGT